MFDLTLFFEKPDGAVIEFRNAQEYTEFVDFFNRQNNVEEIAVYNLDSKFIDERTLCVRIYKRPAKELLVWMFGPTRQAYEVAGCKVVNLEDIRVGSCDLGDLSSEDVDFESLFIV